MESVILALILACLALVLLWRSAVKDARYHEDNARHYRETALTLRELLGSEGEKTLRREREALADLERRIEEERDSADWWKGEDA